MAVNKSITTHKDELLREGARSIRQDRTTYNRKHKRHDLNILTDIYVGAYNVGDRAFLKDISLKGAGFWSNERFGPGTKISFEIEKLTLSGEVMHSDPASCGLHEWGMLFDRMGFFKRLRLNCIIKRIRRKNELESEDTLSEPIMKKDEQTDQGKV